MSLGGPSPLPTATGGMAPQQIETLYTMILDLDHRLEWVQSSSIDQELHLQLTERASDNGILIWKVDKFEQQRKEVMEGVTLSFSTPPPSLQVGTATKCVPGPTWRGMGWGKELISAFLGIRIQLATSTQLVQGGGCLIC